LIAPSAYASEGMLREQVQSMAAAVFDPLPSVTQVLDENEYSDAMVDLGRFLFFDKRMSAAGDISCASCHGMDTGGGDGRPTSVGHIGAIGGRNAPSVFNAIFNVEQFWDGRAPDLEEQAKGPIQNPIEMANSDQNLVATLLEIPGYVERFSTAFPDQDEPITFDNIATAIAAFEAMHDRMQNHDAHVNGGTK
jgi:cytochrome c peroxidase